MLTTLIGSNRLETLVYEFQDFDKVNIGNAFEVELLPGDAFGVEVTFDHNLRDQLAIRQEQFTLYIHLKNGVEVERGTLRAIVTCPRLIALELAGSSHACFHDLHPTEVFTLVTSGTSHAKGRIMAGTLRVGTSGASSVTLEGSIQQAYLAASGSSHIDMRKVLIESCTAHASGSSRVQVQVSRSLRADANGDALITSEGNHR